MDGEVGVAGETALQVEWQVGLPQHRVGFDAGGPHQCVGVEAVSVAERYVVIGRRFESGVWPDLVAGHVQFGDRLDTGVAGATNTNVNARLRSCGSGVEAARYSCESTWLRR